MRYITVMLAVVLTVEGVIRFKADPSKHETNQITFVIADWMNVLYYLDGKVNSEFTVKPMNGYIEFYKNIYRPIVSGLSKYKNNVSHETSLITFHKQRVVILDDERPHVQEKWRFKSFEYKSKDWTFVSEWLAEYAVQIEQKTSTLFFFCKDLPPLVKDALDRIQKYNKATVIIVSDGDIDIDGLMTEILTVEIASCTCRIA